MSKLEELIQQYCPDGVEYYHLNDMATIKRGERVTKAQLIPDGQYPVISGGVKPLGYLNRYNREANTITIAQYGTAGYVDWQQNQFWANDVCYSVFSSKIINNRFLYFVLLHNQQLLYSLKTNAIPACLPLDKLAGVEIPVPPLPVQEEIVRILDNFTELQAELQAELQKRLQQYNYYRDKLLSFNNINRGGRQTEVRWMKLKDIGKVCMCKRILKSQTSSSGDVPFFKIGTFGGDADAYISQALFNEYKAKYSYPQKGDILISAAGTIGRTIVFDGTPSYFQDSNIVWLRHDESIVLNSYLRFCYTLNPWVVSTGGTIARLYNDNILEATIPVPSLSDQQKIVSILDRFDTLTNDLSSGLPAEIEKRRQQYEYYRDKLLTFKRKAA